MYRYWRFEQKEFEQRTIRSVFLASLIHALVVAGVYSYSKIAPPPPPLDGAVTVNFEALGDAKGKQTYTKAQGKTPSLNQSIAVPPKLVKRPKVKTKKPAKAKLAAKKLRPKKTKPKAKKIAPPALVAKESPVVVEKPVDDPVSEIEKELLAAQALDDDLIEKEPLPSEESKPNLMAAKITPPSDSIPSETQKMTAKPTALPEKYGVPQGTKSYLDLRQRSGNRKPVYPYMARRRYQEGRTVLLYYVNSDGSVKDISIKQSSGHATLDASAIEAIKNWRYFPGQSGWTIHPVNYYLNGPTQESFSRLRTRR